jgi:AcrR family transcriptional regulator
MSRKPEYELNEVFDRAIPAFLSHGYFACSMDTLINITDFNRRAFYIEFENKQAFADALLNYYIEYHLTPLQSELEVKAHFPQAIICYFKAYQQLIDKQGCLLVRLILELGKSDPNIQNQARRYYDNLQSSFIACLEKAVAHSELPASTNIEALAMKLSSFAQGLAVSNHLKQGDDDALIVIKTLFE